MSRYTLNFRSIYSNTPSHPRLTTQTVGADLANEPRITFLVHGFSVSDAKGRKKLTELAKILEQDERRAYVSVLWPGDAPSWGPARRAVYPFATQKAKDCAKFFIDYLEELELPTGTNLSFISHSLGARFVMEIVRLLGTTDYRVSRVCLMAAAINDDSLVDEYDGFGKVVERLAVLASRMDMVLLGAYPAGTLLQLFRYRNTDVRLALGTRGPRPSRPSEVFHEQIPIGRNVQHGDYLPDPNLPACDKSRRKQSAASSYALRVITYKHDPSYL